MTADPEQLRSQFDEFDKDGNGKIDLSEFRELLTTLGEQMEPAAAEALFDGVDSDETGLVDFEEFSKWWTAR